MLGFGDFVTFLGYGLTVLSAVACVIVGIILWNKEV